MTDYGPASHIAGILGAMAPDGPRRVLVVDDETSIRTAMSKFLRSRGYEVESADSGASALGLLVEKGFDALLCDVRMPGMSGTEVVPRALEISPDLAILMLTAVNDAPTATEMLARGAMDYLMKPVELADLAVAVARALRRRDTAVRERHVERLIRDEVLVHTVDLRRGQRMLEEVSVDVVGALVHAQEAKDAFMRGHSERVAEMAVAMGRVMRLADDEVGQLRIAGRLHDVGNIGVPEAVLNTPGPLSPEARARMQEHVRIGVEVLSPLTSLARVLPFVQDHHERWDGGGYPRQLAGEQSCLGGRILAAADALDALTSRRAYRSPVSVNRAVELLAPESGTQLDPLVFEALRQVAPP